MKEKKIIETIEYLNDEGENNAIAVMKCEDLITLLIHAINSKMPKWCTECHDWYRFEEGCKPQIKCMFCSLGMHNCNSIEESIIRRGLKWVCSGCSDNESYEGNIGKVKFMMIQKLINRNGEANNTMEDNRPDIEN